MNKAIFLDRDGTINVEKDYLYKIEDFEFIDGVVDALRLLQNAGFLLIIITNQSGIARGYYSEEDYHTLNSWMIKELKNHGVDITAVYFCPHHSEAKVEKYRINCSCRKPKLGMYEQAIKDFNLDVSKCYAIGDKIRDSAICESTGCHGYLIATNEKIEVIEAVKRGEYKNVSYAADLKDAAERILLHTHAKNVRRNIIQMISNAQSGHPGGSLSAADILTILYFEIMDITPENAGTLDRDRFVLSEGHASPLLYSVLAETGILDSSELLTFRKLHSHLQGHPDMNKVNGVDMTTGSLRQGLSAAVGMALANKLDHNVHRVYCLIGDGEAEEGQIWEAAMSAAHYNCDNLCVIIDHNGLQIDGRVEDVIGPTPFEPKFEAFGWHVISADGHDFDSLRSAFNEAKTVQGKPTCIVAKTIKGKGVSFMEDVAEWHGKAPDVALTEIALMDLE